jgi:hypothetical protein
MGTFHYAFEISLDTEVLAASQVEMGRAKIFGFESRSGFNLRAQAL